jgi:hypothetical protein
MDGAPFGARKYDADVVIKHYHIDQGLSRKKLAKRGVLCKGSGEYEVRR